MKKTKGVGLVAVVVAMVGLVPAAGAQQKLRIVVIGDSSASGEGNPDDEGPVQKPRWRGTSHDGLDDAGDDELAGRDELCHRSKHAGNRVAADGFRAAHEADVELEFKSFGCTGATVHELIDRNQLTVIEPQIDRVRKRYGSVRIDALVVHIGINDVGFAQVIGLCSVVPFDHCPWYFDLEERVQQLDERYDWLAEELGKLDENGRALDIGNVFLVAYPEAASWQGGYCASYVQAPVGYRLDPLLNGINVNESMAAEQSIHRLNEVMAGAAARHGWHFIGDHAETFHGHGWCEGTTPWIRTLTESFITQRNHNGAMHPNREGHEQYAKAIAPRYEWLIPPEETGLLGVHADPKTGPTEVSPRAIVLRWKPSERAARYQIGWRRVPYEARPGAMEAPPRGAPQASADAPTELDRSGGWEYIEVDGGQTVHHTHAGVNMTNAYAVRACTPAACSAWSEGAQVSNQVPAAPASLRPIALTDSVVKVAWDQAQPGDPFRNSHQLAFKRRESASYNTVTLTRSSATHVLEQGYGTWDLHVRACSHSICSSWASLQTSNLRPDGLASNLRLDFWSMDGTRNLVWHETSTNETRVQLYLWPMDRAAHLVDLAASTRKLAVGATRFYAGAVRACSDRGCTSWSPLGNADIGLQLTASDGLSQGPRRADAPSPVSRPTVPLPLPW